MTHIYEIDGMTCGNCVAKVKDQLLRVGDITTAEVQLRDPQATISMQKHISLPELQKAVSKAGNFIIKEHRNHEELPNDSEAPDKSWLATYKPIIVIAAYITGITLFIEIFNQPVDFYRWMQNFMAGFFLIFSFFKMLDLKGFSESYSTYDIIAKRWAGWGYLYAFAELILGVAFLLRLYPLLTNWATLILMSISLVGVLQAVLSKKKIRCACLGAVFNLPMSTVTIIEDVLMIGMSALMIVSMI